MKKKAEKKTEPPEPVDPAKIHMPPSEPLSWVKHPDGWVLRFRDAVGGIVYLHHHHGLWQVNCPTLGQKMHTIFGVTNEYEAQKEAARFALCWLQEAAEKLASEIDYRGKDGP